MHHNFSLRRTRVDRGFAELITLRLNSVFSLLRGEKNSLVIHYHTFKRTAIKIVVRRANKFANNNCTKRSEAKCCLL